jgi:hypothetical protein
VLINTNSHRLVHSNSYDHCNPYVYLPS